MLVFRVKYGQLVFHTRDVTRKPNVYTLYICRERESENILISENRQFSLLRVHCVVAYREVKHDYFWVWQTRHVPLAGRNSAFRSRSLGLFRATMSYKYSVCYVQRRGRNSFFILRRDVSHKELFCRRIESAWDEVDELSGFSCCHLVTVCDEIRLHNIYGIMIIVPRSYCGINCFIWEINASLLFNIPLGNRLLSEVLIVVF